MLVGTWSFDFEVVPWSGWRVFLGQQGVLQSGVFSLTRRLHLNLLLEKTSWTKVKNEAFQLLLLMAEIRRENQLRLVVYPTIYEVYTFQVVQDFFH